MGLRVPRIWLCGLLCLTGCDSGLAREDILLHNPHTTGSSNGNGRHTAILSGRVGGAVRSSGAGTRVHVADGGLRGIASRSAAENALDTIVFASPTSVSSHDAVLTNCTVAAAPPAGGVPKSDIGLAFDLVSGGSITFVMTVDPAAQTHITVKFWGGVDVVNGSRVETQQNTWLLDPAKNFTTQHGWSHEWPCELDQADPLRSSAAIGAFPQRWQYATYPLPLEWTAGRTTIRLGLGTGVFQWYGGPQYFPSRQLFRAYTHTAPYLTIPVAETQGVAPADAPPRPPVPAAEQLDQLSETLGGAVQQLFDAQVWNWTDVEAGRMPACLFGAPSTYGFKCALLPNGRANMSGCKQQWQSGNDAGNLPWSSSLAALGAAYSSQAKWATNFSGQGWVLNRVVGAMDVHVRAQGSNGGFRYDHGDGTGLWVGGPHRIPAKDPLEGWGHTGLARAFTLVFDGMSAAGLLEIAIDDDDNTATPNVTRRDSYLAMFNASRTYLTVTGSTYCPNQQLGDAKGVWAANRAIELLAPEHSWPEDRILNEVVLPTLGLTNFSDAMWNAKNSKCVPSNTNRHYTGTHT
jgi:hypothetical protein